jgi:hypothetical protein
VGCLGLGTVRPGAAQTREGEDVELVGEFGLQMRVDCTWCPTVMVPGDASKGVSHGCCRECWPKVLESYGLAPRPYPERN